MTLHDAGQTFKESGKKFLDDNGPRLGAALAFCTAVSLSPLLLAVVSIAGLAFGREAASGQIVEQIRDVVGQEAATVIEQLVLKSSNTSHGIVAAVIAFAVLLFGASGVFAELQSAQHRLESAGPYVSGWHLDQDQDRLLSFSLVCGTAFLLLVSLVISAVLSAINGTIAGWLPGMDILAEVINFLISLGLTTVLFAMIFQWLPETDLSWSDVWVGAAVTAGLFAIGRYLIGLYLGRAAVGSAYGAAGAFVALLVWIYYSTQILLFGAELTFVYAT